MKEAEMRRSFILLIPHTMRQFCLESFLFIVHKSQHETECALSLKTITCDRSLEHHKNGLAHLFSRRFEKEVENLRRLREIKGGEKKKI